MAFEFAFQIDPDKIIIQDTQTGYHLQVSNRVVYRKKDGLLLDLGETEETARARLSGRYDWDTGEVRSCSLFNAEGGDLVYEIQAMESFTRLLHRQSQEARPAAHFATKLGDGFDYLLAIPGYEPFPEARRNALEQSLQAHLRLRRLVINGRAVHMPMWKRNLEFYLRRLLTLFLPLAATVAGYLTMPRLVASNPLTFLAYLLFITYFSYYVGKILWMLLTRRIIPADYRLCMLQGWRSSLSRVDRMLARIFWASLI
jgi:hypothetical protein